MALKKIPKYVNGYETCEFLGKGSFANVFRCKKHNRDYAMKRVNSEDRFKKYALREIHYLKKMKSDRVVRIVDDFMDDNIQYLVFEYLNENLCQYFLKNNAEITFSRFTSFCYQIADGLSYLHSENLIHCDLKLENVMISNNLTELKIIDLGSSVERKSISKCSFYIQSRYYRAPEVLYEIGISDKIDIWSYGIIITEMLLRKCIFAGKNSLEMIYKISDFLGIPNFKKYRDSNVFSRVFYLYNNEYIYSALSKNCKIKGYRESRLEEYIIFGINQNYKDALKYQIENTLKLIFKILDYNFETRLTAEECKKQLLLIETEL